MSTPSEEFLIMYNLQQIRIMRPWIDAEFTMYQKLCRNREAILDVQLINIKIANKKAKRELRESSRKTNKNSI